MEPGTKKVTLALPSPISTNALFANNSGRGRRGRKATDAYSAWKKLTAQWLMCQAPLPSFAAPVEVLFYVGEGGVGMMDSDNTLKAYLDALKDAQVIRDDNRKWVWGCSAVWTPELCGCVAVIVEARNRPRACDVLADVQFSAMELLA